LDVQFWNCVVAIFIVTPANVTGVFVVFCSLSRKMLDHYTS
jgi:hypothetical protein